VHQPQIDGLIVAGDAEQRRWDEWAVALVDEARRMRSQERTVRLPESVSASLLMRALDHQDEVARDIVRPMPQAPAPAARRGTALHTWIESRFGQQTLFDPDDLPGAADASIGTDEALQELKTAFEAGPFSRLSPVAIEEPFALLLGGRVINGRIDAVFEEDGVFDVVDWKTGSTRNLHSMQLAIYRVAWAQLRSVPVERVTAGFAMIASGEMLRPDTSDDVARLIALGARVQ
jgi:DNA helicase-2/ATP-dependent DNA helicase PcrA